MLFRVVTALALFGAPPPDDAPVIQRPGQSEAAPPPAPTKPESEPEPAPEPAPELAPQPAPQPVTPQTQRPADAPPAQRPAPAPSTSPAIVPLGEAPQPEPTPAPVALPVAPPPPPPPPKKDVPLEAPKGPGTGFIAGGAVLGGVGLGIMTAALASDGFAPRAWQRAIIVPLSMAAIGGGSALLIIGLRRRVLTRRWNERETVVVPVLGPGSVGLRGRF